MGKIIYIKTDLLAPSLPKNAYRAHACNSLGVWGRGIAKAFKDKYPESFTEYKAYCEKYGPQVLGKSFVTGDNVICLMTSYGYNPPDRPYQILARTDEALRDMAERLPSGRVEIYSNRFNSGLFHVPWEDTEAVIEEFLIENPNIEWIVCDKE